MNDLKAGLITLRSVGGKMNSPREGSAFGAGSNFSAGAKEGFNGTVRTMGYSKPTRLRAHPMDTDTYGAEETIAPKPDIYAYDSHQEFLRDRFQYVQSQDAKFSHRVLAKAAGFANPGFFNDIVKGRRKVNSIGLERFGRALGMESDELEFAQCLMVYTEAEEGENRDIASEMLERRRKRKNFKRLKHTQSKYYLDFNYMLIRAAIEVCDFRGDYKKLGEFLVPAMPPETIKPYVRDLCEWNLVTQDSNGSYRVTNAFQEPPPGLRDMMMRTHKALLCQTSNLLTVLPMNKTHVSTALVTVSEDAYKEIMRYVGKFRDQMLEIVRADRNPDRVAAISIQCIPRSQKPAESKRA